MMKRLLKPPAGLAGACLLLPLVSLSSCQTPQTVSSSTIETSLEEREANMCAALAFDGISREGFAGLPVNDQLSLAQWAEAFVVTCPKA